MTEKKDGPTIDEVLTKAAKAMIKPIKPIDSSQTLKADETQQLKPKKRHSSEDSNDDESAGEEKRELLKAETYFLMVKNISQKHDQEILLNYLTYLYHQNYMRVKLKTKMMRFDDGSGLCFVFYYMSGLSKYFVFFVQISLPIVVY